MGLFNKHFSGLIVCAAVWLTAACQIENLPANVNNSNADVAAGRKKTPAPPAPAPPASLPPLEPNRANANPEIIAVSKLIVPVAGIKKEDLRDTFNDARSEGRVHNALDVMAAGGTPVLAATNGRIMKFHDSELGGITIYQISSEDPRLVLYYAHLQRRADDLVENTEVKKGTVIGYVGDTGNAGAGNFHLHFAMWVVDDPKHYWDGANVNPYDYLK
jgi:murein DD-endopeptidase MepM/ murein hydrolase activator NlpD